jgi:hypothetical protein
MINHKLGKESTCFCTLSSALPIGVFMLWIGQSKYQRRGTMGIAKDNLIVP